MSIGESGPPSARLEIEQAWREEAPLLFELTRNKSPIFLPKEFLAAMMYLFPVSIPIAAILICMLKI
jgi:hypothetical protein